MVYEHLFNETSKLQAGLMILMENTTASVSVSYKQLCTAAKQDEKQQIGTTATR